MTLLEAYNAWVATFPKVLTIRPAEEITYEKAPGNVRTFKYRSTYDGDCCKQLHFKTVIDDHCRAVRIPKPDSEVCDRERAWRTYCRMRDLH